ncbi:MAG TPA: CoA transferase, partial [Planctomycetota bacterium]|nr:CoA transferase [Planctomycetota bacterium]
MAGVLDGLRVLDLSWGIAGPICTMLLADHGAEVTRIERPRGEEPADPRARLGAHAWHRGKRSAVLDLKDPGDAALFCALAREADVLVESMSPGATTRLGIDYPALSAANPRLIYCSITGYGQSGPKAHLAAHDLNYVAETGLLHLTAGPDGAPVV